MKRRHQVVLFAVLLLSLTILSPSFDFRGSPLNQDRDQDNHSFPNTSSRNEDQQAPVEIVVSMSEEEFQLFSKIAHKVADGQLVEINLRNVESDTYKDVLDNEFAVGDSGDVILLDSAEIQHYAKRGHLYPLNATTLSKSLGETVSRLREMTEWNGYQWGMPYDFDPYVLASRSQFLEVAGLETLPQTEDQWTKLVDQVGKDNTKLLAININDPYAASAWLNQFDPEVAPNKVNRAQRTSQNGAYGQVLQLLDRIQPHIQTESSNPELSGLGNQKQAPMAVTRLSRLIRDNQIVSNEKNSVKQIMFTALSPVESRSFVITSGSAETEQAGRWIEGMTSAAMQSEWYQQAHHMPAKQQELDRVLQKQAAVFDRVDRQEWFPAETSQAETDESHMQMSTFKKKIQQLLRGEITANQYVNSILDMQSSLK